MTNKVSPAGSSKVFRKALAPLALSDFRAFDDGDFVAAPEARERERLDERADLIDFDLLRILLEAHHVSIGMTVRAQQDTRGAHSARRR